METKESVFVHINNAIDEIKEGNLVTYEVEMGPKGPTAVQVKQSK
jgi:cold shock CspA family protein